MAVEGYVCNNDKCRSFGTPYYIEDEVLTPECPRCKQERTPLMVYNYIVPEVQAKDVMPNISTKGFTHKMKGR